MSNNGLSAITLNQITLAFVPMGLLLVWALMQPELGGDLELGRTKLTIWATTILLAPAQILFLFRSVSRSVANMGYLLWTASWLVFLVHAYWAIFVIFDGVPDTIEQMGVLISAGNFTLLGLWTVDIVLLWLLPAERQRAWLQWASRILAFAIFSATLVILREGSAQILGIAYTGALIVAGLLRLGTHVQHLDGQAEQT